MTDVIYQEIKEEFFNLLFTNGKYNSYIWSNNKSAKKLKQKILNSDDFGEMETFQERIWSLLNNDCKIKKRCIVCGNKTNLKGVKEDFRDTCCNKCATKNPQRIIKIQNTNIERYGVECTLQNKEIRNKADKTILERYGVKNAAQSKIVQNKISQTCLERYGKKYYFETENFKNSYKKTCKERFGVENVLQSPIIQEKVKQTCLKRYNVENISQCTLTKQKITQGSIKKFGYNHPMHNPEIAQKCFNKGVKYMTLPSGKEIYYQRI